MWTIQQLSHPQHLGYTHYKCGWYSWQVITTWDRFITSVGGTTAKSSTLGIYPFHVWMIQQSSHPQHLGYTHYKCGWYSWQVITTWDRFITSVGGKAAKSSTLVYIDSLQVWVVKQPSPQHLYMYI